DELRELIAAAARGADREDFLSRLAANGVPCAPIQDLAEVVSDEQVQHLGLVTSTRGDRGAPARHVRTGVTAPGWLDEGLGDAPGLGEDTHAVLQAWGADQQRFEEAVRAGAVGLRSP